MTFDLVWSIMEHVGVIAFAISGAVVAIDREMDLVGVVLLSFITSFGGGILRDLLLGAYTGRGISTPLFFTDSYATLRLVCLIASVAVIVFAMAFKTKFIKEEKLLDSLNNYIDAIGIGAFTVSGASLAVETVGADAFVAILMGVIACIGGGVLRDMMLNDVPFVLRKRIYILATAAGAAVFYIIYKLDPELEIMAMIVGALTTITIRVLATIFRWNIPKAINFSKERAELEAEGASDESGESV
ncbi:MAG: trimeric intracellular cation channel family protein [Clostridia bacterium]|nr:trimeric intracellular cation channel family protein [Clostridia bacterium]